MLLIKIEKNTSDYEIHTFNEKEIWQKKKKEKKETKGGIHRD